MLETLLWIAGGAVLVLALGMWWMWSSYTKTSNLIVALDQRCNTAFADIDVHLKHRHNLIPPLLQTVKGVRDYEEKMVLTVLEARAEALQAVAPQVRLKAEGNLTAQVTQLLSSIDKTPELRALPEFSNLRRELTECEERITAARRFYNLAIEEYNTVLRQFPGSHIANKKRLSTRQPFDLGVERVLIDEPISLAF